MGMPPVRRHTDLAGWTELLCCIQNSTFFTNSSFVKNQSLEEFACPALSRLFDSLCTLQISWQRLRRCLAIHFILWEKCDATYEKTTR